MIRSLVDDFDNRLSYGDTVLYIDMTFDNILLFIELLEDQDVGDVDKITFGLEMLVENYEAVEEEPLNRKVELFNFIVDEFLKGGGTEKKEPDDETGGRNNMDFTKDADLIYASFLFDYGLDLFEARGALDWRKFVSLLRNLSDETPFKEAVKYRTMKLPSAKVYGQEYRDHVMKMKRLYSLDEGFDGDQVLDAVADVFRV